MSYTPNTWETGDVITSAKLNAIEQGIANAGGGGGSAVLKITATVSDSTCTLGSTAAEIEAAIDGGAFAVVYVPNEDDGYDILTLCGWFPYTEEFGYAFKFYGSVGGGSVGANMFEAAAGTDYPSCSI